MVLMRFPLGSYSKFVSFPKASVNLVKRLKVGSYSKEVTLLSGSVIDLTFPTIISQ